VSGTALASCRLWLNWYFEACANSGGKAPDDVAEFLPWNFSADASEGSLENESQSGDSHPPLAGKPGEP